MKSIQKVMYTQVALNKAGQHLLLYTVYKKTWTHGTLSTTNHRFTAIIQVNLH